MSYSSTPGSMKPIYSQSRTVPMSMSTPTRSLGGQAVSITEALSGNSSTTRRACYDNGRCDRRTPLISCEVAQMLQDLHAQGFVDENYMITSKIRTTSRDAKSKSTTKTSCGTLFGKSGVVAFRDFDSPFKDADSKAALFEANKPAMLLYTNSYITQFGIPLICNITKNQTCTEVMNRHCRLHMEFDRFLPDTSARKSSKYSRDYAAAFSECPMMIPYLRLLAVIAQLNMDEEKRKCPVYCDAEARARKIINAYKRYHFDVFSQTALKGDKKDCRTARKCKRVKRRSTVQAYSACAVQKRRKRRCSRK